MPDENDTEYEDHIITRVDGPSHGYYTLSLDGYGIGMPDIGIAPVVGDALRLYGRGFGYSTRGMVLRHTHVIYYRTEAEDREYHRREQEKRDAERRQQFEATGRAELDAQYAALPPEFQRRLDRFRAHCPDFRWQHEPYEMSCCVDAVLIAAYLRTQLAQLVQGASRETIVDAVRAFHDLPWDEQKRRVPELFDGHSGNTFAMACRLAAHYLIDPTVVEREHAAIAPLVGCTACGCWHSGEVAE